MGKDDIKYIRRILEHRGKNELADLLKYSRGVVDESSTYGSYLFSTLSIYKIYSPLGFNERLNLLTEDDKITILDAVLEIYPHQAEAPEITDIVYYVDFEIETDSILIPTGNLSDIGFGYVTEQIDKCNQKIEAGDYDGAITNARTLVENVCIFLIEEEKGPFEYNGDLPKLYKEVNKTIGIDPSLFKDENIKQTLRGFINIINGLSGLSNELGDRHGTSQGRYLKPKKRHAVLIVNSAFVICEYLYTSWAERKKK